MKALKVCLLIVVLGLVLRAPSQVDEPLGSIKTIPIPGLHDGTFDHFQVDLAGQRLFVAAEDNSAVEVIDWIA